jgi:exodeoxyribonuclease VII large subunit
MQINEAIWNVSALNFEIRTLLEKGIGTIWIEGEISNLARPASGHWYFSLKDERAQLRAAMFKNRNGRVAFEPKNGQQVLIRAQVTLYEARGEFQVVVDHMEEAGVGRLMQQYEALKKRLSAEGLFADAHKKKIPLQAKHIGIITSPTGAAIRDALSVIRRRSPGSEVTIFPTPVQGDAATEQIVQAIELANRHGESDVLLLIRGGGSLEDLWRFNEESVARAIFASEIPIVSGIGHEIDFTIADFVADTRAPTPSVAAETVTMDQYEIMQQLDVLSARLLRQMRHRLEGKQQQVEALQQRLLRFHPDTAMDNLKQRLQFAQSRLLSIQQARLKLQRSRFQAAVDALHYHNPQRQLPVLEQQLETRRHQLSEAMKARLEHQRHRLSLQARSLDNLSPLKTLSRGFATISKKGEIVSSVQQLSSGDDVEIRLQDGAAQAQIR